MFLADGDFDTSPNVSPSRLFQALDHSSNEVEAPATRTMPDKNTQEREREWKIAYHKCL